MDWLTNPTQQTAFVAFAAAAVTALLCGGTRGFRVIAGAQALFACEIAAGWRFVLLAAERRLFTHFADYGARGAWQMIVVGFVVVALLMVLPVVTRHLLRGGDRRLKTAALATIVTALSFGLELLSWHPLDALLYRMIGPLMVIGWLWLACAICVAAMAIVSARGRRKPLATVEIS
jgi:hypothetical protein